MDITLEFNKKRYTLPADIREYIKILNITESVHIELQKDFNRKSTNSHDGIVLQGNMRSSFRTAAETYIQLLCKKNIYSCTVEDFLSFSDAYTMFSELSTHASRTVDAFYNEKEQNYQRSAQIAERKALSQITGSGVSVYSSNFLTLAMASAVEYSALKGQYSKANNYYKNELKYLRGKEEIQRKIKERTYYNGQYRPQAENLLQIFSYEMMQKYLEILIENKLLDSNILRYIDINQSQNILDNIRTGVNKEKTLEESFLACPFNVSVYFELCKLGKLDNGTLASIQELDLTASLIAKLEEAFAGVRYAGDICSVIEMTKNITDSLSLITGQRCLYYYRKLTDPVYNSIIFQYKTFAKMILSKEGCLDLLQKSGRDIAIFTNEEIQEFAANRVTSMFSNREYNAIVTIGQYEDLTEKICPVGLSFKKKEDIDQYLISTLNKNLLNLIREIMDSVADKERKTEKQSKDYKTKITLLQFTTAISLIAFCIFLIVFKSFSIYLAFCGIWPFLSFWYQKNCKQKMDELKSDDHIALAAAFR